MATVGGLHDETPKAYTLLIIRKRKIAEQLIAQATTVTMISDNAL
jgi:hypothetical protein